MNQAGVIAQMRVLAGHYRRRDEYPEDLKIAELLQRFATDLEGEPALGTPDPSPPEEPSRRGPKGLVTAAILAACADVGKSSTQVAEETGMSRPNIAAAMSRLKSEGRLRIVDRGHKSWISEEATPRLYQTVARED